MIYFIFWGILYIAAFCDSSTNKKLVSNNLFIVYSFIFVFFLVLAGMRYKTGYDWQNYMPYFEEINDRTMFNKMEIGYACINCFFKNLFNSFSLMIFIIAFFCTLSLFNFCRTYSPYPFVSLFVYGTTLFLSYNMGLYRQSIAMAISLSTMRNILNKKYVSAILCFLASLSFHSSAVVTILYFLCTKIHFNSRQRIVLLFSSLLLNIFGFFVIAYFVKIVFSFTFLPDSISKYRNYFITALGGKTEFSSGLGLLLRTILILIIFLLKKEKSEIINAISNLVLIGCFINAFARNIEIFDRLSKYFSMYEMIFFTYLIIIIKKYCHSCIKVSFFMLFLLYFFLGPRGMIIGKGLDGKSSWAYFSPWHSTIFKIEEPERIARMRRSI